MARTFTRFFLPQTLLFLIQPAGVVSFPRDPVTAVKFKNPFGSVVQEVAVVRDRNDCPRELMQELFEPIDALRVEVVGRFV